MNEEIKEILEYYQKDIDRYEENKNEMMQQFGYSEKIADNINSEVYQRYKNHKLLLDYITNLREENEKLKEVCDKYEEEHSTKFNEWVFDKRENEKLTQLWLDSQEKRRKAIEYIRENDDFYYGDELYDGYQEIINILKGDKDE